MEDLRLHPLPSEALGIAPPLRFTYPFCYEAHPLCRLAAESVKLELSRHTVWQTEISNGKMLGVLVVEGGFLAAFSGTLCGKSNLPYFVPPVYDLHEGYFQEEEERISSMPPGVKRKQRSQALQKWLFEQFHFLNALGKTASLPDIFGKKTPPSGSGECCAPKLLQYAFLHGYHPLCMAEFWMGRPPKDEIRQEGDFYPACRSRCKPILEWMMQGLEVEVNPLLENYQKTIQQLRVLYEDANIIVVDKPSGMLSVPGKDDLPSLADILKDKGAVMVHRLDMDTSGLMVIARNEAAYHHLQEQFIHHTIHKRYSALLENSMKIGSTGKIDLPICPNPYDRPRQIVNKEYGKRSITRYEIVDNIHGHALVHLWPETGRTHQLRVHMAHPSGLGNPIVGDRLYGHVDKRLMLCADELTFFHPRTGEEKKFQLSLPFV